MHTNPIQDRSALRWIGDDLNELLRGARRNLEAFAEGDGDITHMRSCRDQLHQIQGTLQMVEIYGGAMLVDEMEKVADAIVDGSIAVPAKAAEPLMLGMVQLPNYLERLEAGDPDIPLNLLPALNDLRAIRQQPVVSEMSMYAPKLEAIIDAEPVDPNQGHGNRALRRELRQWRGQFQRGILGWYKEPQVTSHLSPIKEQLVAVLELARTSRLRRLLQAADALVVDIMEAEALPDKDEKLLFGRLDRFFKQIIDFGEEPAVHDFPVDLLRHILYYVSRSKSDNPAVRKIRDLAFEANSFFDPDADRSEATAVGANRELYAAVGDALRQDLRTLKDDLDLYIRGDRDDLPRLEALSVALTRVGDTLGVIGSGNLRGKLKARAEQIVAIVKSGSPPEDEPLMAIAHDILQVESALGDLDKPRRGGRDAAAQTDVGLSKVEMREHTANALQEAFFELNKVKDAFSGFLRSPDDARSLGQVSGQLQQVSGVLQVLGEPQAGALLSSLAPYCEELANGGRGLPDDREKDAVADIVTGVEFYLEAMQEDRCGRQEILAYARTAGETLGLAVPAAQVPAETPHIELVAAASPVELAGDETAPESLTLAEGELADADEVPSNAMPDEAATATKEPTEPTLTVIDGGKADAPHETAKALDLAEHAEAEPLELDLAELPGLSAAQRDKPPSDGSAENAPAADGVGEGFDLVLDTAEESAAPPDFDEAVDLQIMEVAEDTDPAPEATQPEAPAAVQLLEDIDEEILEVFLEEAREELAVIQEQYPRWRADADDAQAMQTFRRSFHTLKGSGRMVGASTIGEFAWSIENLLNRVIDHTVAVDERLTGVLDEACAVLPGLVDAQAGEGVADVVSAERISARANRLADPSLADAEQSGEASEQAAEGSVALSVEPSDGDTTPPEISVGALDEAMAESTDTGESMLEPLAADATFDADQVDAVEPATAVDAEASEAPATADETVEELPTSTAPPVFDAEVMELELADFTEPDAAADFEAVLEPVPPVAGVTDDAPGASAESPTHEELEEIKLEPSGLLERPPDEGATPPEMASTEPEPASELVPGATMTEESGEGVELGAQPVQDAKDAADFMDEIVLSTPGLDPSQPEITWQPPATESTTEQPAAVPESAAREDADAPRPFLGSNVESVEEDVDTPVEVGLNDASIELDATLHEVFRSEAQAHFEKLAEFLDRAREAPEPVAFDQDFERAWHTLHGSARMAGVDPVAELAKSLERYVNVERQLGRVADPESVALLTRGESVCQTLVETINTAGVELPAWRPLCEEVARMTAELETGVSAAPCAAEASAATTEYTLDPELLEIFLEEARELNERMETEFQAWMDAPDDRSPVADLQRTLHTLKGGARLAGITQLGDLSHSMESLFEAVVGGDLVVSEPLQNVIRRGVDYLAGAVETLHDAAPLPDPGALLARMEAASRGEFTDSQAIFLDSADLTEGAADAGLEPDSKSVEADATTDLDAAGFDLELLEIFLEEARELNERMETEFQAWTATPQARAPVADLQRTLHTFKGGARLAGLGSLGDLSHALESLFETVVDGDLEVSEQLQAVVRQGVDLLAGAIEALPSAARIPDTRPLVARIEAAVQGEFSDSIYLAAEPAEEELSELVQGVDEALEMASEDIEDSQLILDSDFLGDSRFVDDSMLAESIEQVQVMPFSPRDDEKEVKRPPRKPLPKTERSQGRRADRVRVNADLLDQLVNGAGEVSIYRARLDQQNNTLDFNLQELDQTVTRLREQLRKLEIETESQILSHHESELNPDFDPLELDRYSTIQELSRALSETVSDLSSIGGTLEDLNRDTETLLLQHARVSNELQDGLLRTRMVPFSSRVSRFQRIVRQTGDSLNKRVELDVREARGEMDRSILERVMAPLEHLLRNAVAHGIEESDVRAASGKSEAGHITLSVQREGTEIVIAVDDDGAGLDRAAIRAKAIDRGLLDPEKSVNDSDLDAYILAPGFTTSKQVTQISGRGVGMDVVQSEVKQLGGTLSVASEPGKGARFTIRLPYTLAITEGLLLQQGEDIFAIPHGTIDGVMRISRNDLDACYKGMQESIEYAGNSYRVRYLGNMLGTGQPDLVEGQKWFPLLLARSGEHRVAVHVDAVLGNRQVVVKSVGAQLVQVRAFTGATILPDGKVALILDINSLVRMDAAMQAAPVVLPAESDVAKSVTVMVVDDSITVRKVTTRLLERHNMVVVTAKDGVDAVTKLQDVHPDVMLLDIEMPRMDGYELARHIQNSVDLQGLPIVMITSRTGEKHRKRAMELGVRHYLGKPYQESDLLEHIYDVLAEQVSE